VLQLLAGRLCRHAAPLQSTRLTCAARSALGRRYEAVLPNAEHGLDKPNKYSAVITQRRSQGAGQAQLYATDVGKIPGGMNKAQVRRSRGRVEDAWRTDCTLWSEPLRRADPTRVVCSCCLGWHRLCVV